MALLTILQFPDPRLRTIAKSVTQVDDRIQQLTDNMLETMYDASGVGLAATQINVHEQIIVIDTSEDQNTPMVFINPVVEVLDSTNHDHEEGCLSVPGFQELVTRPKHIRVTALDRNGEPFTIEPTDLLAVCIQHEIDHLNGKLFVDYLSNLKRKRIRSKIEKTQRKQS